MTEQDAINAARVLKDWCGENFKVNEPCSCHWDGHDINGKWECKLFGMLPLSWTISKEAHHDD